MSVLVAPLATSPEWSEKRDSGQIAQNNMFFTVLVGNILAIGETISFLGDFCIGILQW